MVESFLLPENLPFSVAIALMVLLGLVQVLGLGDVIDGDAEIDTPGSLTIDAGLLSLMGLRRLPFLMWAMLLLTAFGLIGLAGQQALAALTGHTLSAWLAGPLAALAAVPVTGALARPLAAIMPRDETTAIDLVALVGREAEIVIGRAAKGSPARARVVDHFGQTHHVMVEPDNDGQTFGEGERILLVRQEGENFRAITRGDTYLPQLD
ncbi:DUF1449 family protein [Methylocystis sp. FS]|uniref:OB-fold-containig protein n=1 Tax=Methylocystis silviterrae TaxID=2743612 RepID=UPI001583BB4B|nr:OB-fold-containig protein [Methylocystis silviterrae]NUJ80681.1 DUF1449 family protein [Methylocystis silviterrae]